VQKQAATRKQDQFDMFILLEYIKRWLPNHPLENDHF